MFVRNSLGARKKKSVLLFFSSGGEKEKLLAKKKSFIFRGTTCAACGGKKEASGGWLVGRVYCTAETQTSVILSEIASPYTPKRASERERDITFCGIRSTLLY